MRILLTISLMALLAPAYGGGTESPHRPGPHGLEGWTIDYPTPKGGPMPRTLVIARNGHVLHRITAPALLFIWMFQDDGAHVAYSTGPQHFVEACILVDTASGKELADYDCFHDPVASTAPSWVKLLKQRELEH
jgi:hypothetical protein